MTQDRALPRWKRNVRSAKRLERFSRSSATRRLSLNLPLNLLSSVPTPTEDPLDRSSLMVDCPILAAMAEFTVGYQPSESARQITPEGTERSRRSNEGVGTTGLAAPRREGSGAPDTPYDGYIIPPEDAQQKTPGRY
jgi:hypothetical protein